MRRRCGARFVAATIHSADTAGYDRHPGGGTTRPKPAPRQGGGAGGGIMQRRLGMWCARPLLRGYIPRPAYPAGSGASYGARDAGRRRLPSAALAAAFCDGAMLLARAFAAVDGACPAPQIRPDPADVTTRLTPRQGGCASRGIMRRRNVARAADGVRRHPRPRILPIRPDPPDVMVRPTPAPRQGEPVAAAALCDGAPQRGTRGCEDSSPVV
mmetsp:Transcript_31064/g.107355  ORF Transcript_31064/g.107355 Transcript_31064/m.107355 type:complete len:213 (+) Transcript_31064:670-1308(+)